MHGYKWPINCTRTRRDGSGAIDIVEFRLGMAAIGLKLDNIAVEQLVMYMDSDNDGTLDKQEFCAKMDALLEEESTTGSAVLSTLIAHLARTNQDAVQFFRELDTDDMRALIM